MKRESGLFVLVLKEGVNGLFGVFKEDERGIGGCVWIRRFLGNFTLYIMWTFVL